MAFLVLIHHAARREEGDLANALSSLRRCQQAGARIVEIDIAPLAGGDFALLHDELLEGETDGAGPVIAATAEHVRALHLRLPALPACPACGKQARAASGPGRHGAVTEEPVGLLSQAVALLAGEARPGELQLDLKLDGPVGDSVLAGLVGLVAGVRDRVRVSSGADWALRRLYELDPALPLGFDPLLYLDLERVPAEPGIPPFRVGAYGYADDHPLAARRWGSTSAYLAARAEALWVQAPMATAWYIRAPLLARMLDDGFDWIEFLHQRGALAVAWTLDPDQPHHLALARKLVDAGVDRITTNNAPGLAVLLPAPAPVTAPG